MQQHPLKELVVSLTDASIPLEKLAPSRVGGKASSLAKLFATPGLAGHVPQAHALTVDFFAPWIDLLKSSDDFVALQQHNDDDPKQSAIYCQNLQTASHQLELTEAQSNAISSLVQKLQSCGPPHHAAVRSSAPEEDGTSASFAGAFATQLGVFPTNTALEQAVRACFASLWEYRVWNYKQRAASTTNNSEIGFCVVVMEMVSSKVAGVAFSANPLNSDRDELVIDSSYGFGESVVDGSVTADRYVIDKMARSIKHESIGNKGSEKLLGTQGGVETHSIAETDPRYASSSLTPAQIEQLTALVCLVEDTYGMPMDVEWAFVDESGSSDEPLQLKLLQARPITTLYQLDDTMRTLPGAPRKLYLDLNIVSEATTTTPFSTLDMDFYQKAATATLGVSFEQAELNDFRLFGDDPDLLWFNGQTRQYVNLGVVLKFVGKERLSRMVETMDPYLASIVRSEDLDETQYRTRCWIPKGFHPRSVVKVLTTVPIWELYTKGRKYGTDPVGSIAKYREIVREDSERLDAVSQTELSSKKGLKAMSTEICQTIIPSILEECAAINFVLLGILSELDDQRRNGATEDIKQEYEALCGGYEGDELMELNIALYRLAQCLPDSIWDEYDHSNMKALAERIQEERDLPQTFLEEWKAFMHKYDFDGQDQLFISCPRYADHPALLLQKLKLNAVGHIKDPSITAKEQVKKRRAVQANHEAEAQKRVEEQQDSIFTLFGRSAKKNLEKIRNRNQILEHVFWIRNAPKLHLAKVIGKIRARVLVIEQELIANGRLEEEGDIFHLSIEEIDRALLEDDKGMPLDLMQILRPRKAVYERALASNLCPLIVDSRCRILQPDPPSKDGPPPEPGTLIGAPISQGVATGTVRIVRSHSDPFEPGEVLCAVVTGPAWTPLFASATAVVLQIGGVLQHGALCAREYGKPAVSNIDVQALLKDGMTVEVDGNTGIVKILDALEEGRRKVLK